MIKLIEPHGGTLCELLVQDDQKTIIQKEAFHIPSLTLTDRQLCDIEMLLTGGFSPLTGFMNRQDYESVLDKLRLADGTLWTIPITLDVLEQFSKKLNIGEKIALRDQEGFYLAVLSITDIWQPDLEKEAQTVFGTIDETHPGVNYLFNIGHKYYIGGSLEGLSLPHHYDYQDYRHGPAQLTLSLFVSY